MAQGVNLNPGATRRLLASLALALLLLAGCGRGKGDISGEVTYKGDPLPYGRITFVSEVGRHDAFRTFIIRGKYRIEAVPAGPAKISIESLTPPTKKQLEEAKKSASGEFAPVSPEMINELSGDPPLKYVKIPSKYSNPETSGEMFTVEKGSQTCSIALKEK